MQFFQRWKNNTESVKHSVRKSGEELKEQYEEMKKEGFLVPKEAWLYLACGTLIMLGILVFVVPVLRFF